MNGHPEDLLRKLDLFLDGELPADEMDAFRDCLMTDPELREQVREDLVLADALERFDLSDAKVSAPAVKVERRSWWLPAAAAAGLVITGFLTGTFLNSSTSEAPPAARFEVAEAGQILDVSSTPRDVDLGGARVRLGPGAKAKVVHTGAKPALALLSGGIEIAAPGGEAEVSVAGFGRVRVRGDSHLVLGRPKPSTDAAYLVVTTWSGTVVVEDGEFVDEVPVGEPRLFDGGGPRLISEVLARMTELEGDEGMLVLTTAEHLELVSNLDQSRETLQQRIGELLAENERLAMELEAQERRTSGPKPSFREYLELMAQKAEKDGLDGRVSARYWRRIRNLHSRFRRDRAKVVTGVREVLLDDPKNVTRQRLGLWFLSRFRHPEVASLLGQYVDHGHLVVRLAAIEGLARQKSLKCKAQLESTFRNDSSVLIRTAAAGGLISLGDYGEPMTWLQGQYEQRPALPNSLRRRILGRILSAPVTVASEYVVQLCRRDGVSLSVQRDVVTLLARIGNDDARATLELLVDRAIRPRIRAEARRRLDGLDRRQR